MPKTSPPQFYLAFENSNCQDYITEKFFVNGLGHSVLPVVMGGRPEDYRRSAPSHSYIHVVGAVQCSLMNQLKVGSTPGAQDDFASPRELAEFLKELDQDDAKYNKYFEWKGTGEFINTRWGQT